MNPAGSVEEALARVSRASFLPPQFAGAADSEVVPMDNGQTVPNRDITLFMLKLAQIRPSDVVLEIGTGSGYQATVLSHLAAEVHTVDPRHVAKSVIDGFPQNVFYYPFDGSKTVPSHYFDAIIVTCAGPGVLKLWRQHMNDGARIVLPVGDRFRQAIRRYRVVEGVLDDEGDFGFGAFMPMLIEGDVEIFRGKHCVG